jgi:hypothetical protein
MTDATISPQTQELKSIAKGIVEPYDIMRDYAHASSAPENGGVR